MSDDATSTADPPAGPPPATPPVPPAAATPPAPPPAPAAPAQSSGFLRGCLIVGVILAAVLSVGGYFAWRFVSNQVLPQIEETADAFEAFSEAPPGPCYDLDLDNGILTGWTEVSCDGPRQVEVSFAADFEDGPFPGDAYLNTRAEDTCRDAFEVYVGTPPEDSVYGADWLLPTEQTWAEGARQGICLVVADDGSKLTATVKESGR